MQETWMSWRLPFLMATIMWVTRRVGIKAVLHKLFDIGYWFTVLALNSMKPTSNAPKSSMPAIVPKATEFLSPWIEALNAASVDPSLELRNLEKVFYPLAIRAHTSAQSSLSTTATAQPSLAENPPLKSNTTALPTSIVAVETPPLEENLTLAVVAPLTSQPIVEGQTSEETEK
nr:hypothetical protein CFP56_14801 [Quercus suber]